MRMRTCAVFSLLLALACTAWAAEPPAPLLKRLHSTEPVFPAEALKEHISGLVTVQFTVDMSGKVRDPRIVTATPPGVFDASVLAAVKTWVYEPVRRDGRLVEVPITTAIRFGGFGAFPSMSVAPVAAPPGGAAHGSPGFDALVDELKKQLESKP